MDPPLESDFDSGVPRGSLGAKQHQDSLPIADVHELFHVHLRVIEDVEHLVAPEANAVMPQEGAGDREVGRIADFDGLVAKGERGHPVLVEASPPAPHNLDVLLRHRLLRQSGGLEALVGIKVCPDPYCFGPLELDHGGEGRFDCGPTALPRVRETPTATILSPRSRTSEYSALNSENKSSCSRISSRTASRPW